MRFTMKRRAEVATGVPAGAAGVLARSMAGRLAWVVPCAVIALGACGSGGVSVSGDVEGLDTLAFRGGEILREADRAPLVLDSMRAASRAEFARRMGDTVPEDALAMASDSLAARAARRAVEDASSPGGTMSRRAQARGDSMARAFASRLTGGATGSDRARGDSVRGLLVWQGAGPTRSVVLRAGTTVVTLSGMATAGISKLVGSEIMVRGVRVTPRDLVVSDYVVRAFNEVPAFDGVVVDARTVRLTDGGTLQRVPLPASLQGMRGARVWVAVKDGKLHAYGLVEAR
ncbi:hypothetical protein [Gemmatimonas sp.]|uniref:hypothetical protein n=1 Tax=Gemmatimonas sp. TaxID=1962908 RepID=UPI0025B815D5|nr:hypothetical protein [Gemmatimonas sp.]MCA2993280.1 hypothetical protein [Gemmatimonas sp.]